MSELNRYLNKTYALSEKEYELMLDEQAGVCAICKRENPSGERLSVDHDHTTNDVRGLLCRKCNAALGQVDDSVEILMEMAAYLKRFGRTERGNTG
jgi:hypothetical protein